MGFAIAPGRGGRTCSTAVPSAFYDTTKARGATTALVSCNGLCRGHTTVALLLLLLLLLGTVVSIH